MDSRLHIEQRAADWLARRDSGRWSERDQTDLDAWLAMSSAHMVEFLRLEAAWEAADRYRAMGAGVRRGGAPTLKEWHAAPFFKHALQLYKEDAAKVARAAVGEPRRLRVSHAVAAAMLLGVAVAAVFYGDRNTYSTAVGMTNAVPLPDGSKVTLNTASAITIEVTDTERRLTLKQGEAYFEVAKDRHRPFVVVAGEQRITALGTAFSVRKLEGEELRVVVTEGQIAVSDAGGGAVRAMLSAGVVAKATGSAVDVQQRSATELDEYLSWRSGFLVFHRTPLAEAVAEFNRYNVRQVIIEDATLATIPVSGNFRATNFDAFARLMQNSMGLRVEEDGNRWVLSGP